MSDEKTKEFWKGTHYDSTVFDRDLDADTLKNNADFLKAARLYYQVVEGTNAPASMSNEELSDWAQKEAAWFNNNMAFTTGKALNITHATPEQKQAFLYIMDVYDHTDTTAGQFVRGLGMNIVDPMNLASVATFGAGAVAGQSAKLALKIGLQSAVKQAIAEKAIAGAIIGGVDGAVQGAVRDGAKQTTEITGGKQDDYSATQTMTSMAIGAGIGGTLGGALGGGASALAPKISNYFSTRAANKVAQNVNPDFPEFSPKIDKFKIYSHLNLDLNVLNPLSYIHWYPIKAMRPRSVEITKPVIQAIDTNMKNNGGLITSIQTLNKNALETIKNGGDASNLIDTFAKNNSTNLGNFKTYLQNLKQHVSDNYKTNEVTHWKADLTEYQKKALLSYITDLEALTDDLAKGVNGKTGQEILDNLKKIQNKEIDFDDIHNSVTGLSKAHLLANNAYMRLTKKYPDGVKIQIKDVVEISKDTPAVNEWVTGLERSIDVGFYNPHPHTGKPLSYTSINKNNLEHDWQNKLLEYAERDDGGKALKIDYAKQVEAAKKFVGILETMYEGGFGHEALMSIDMIRRLRMVWGGKDLDTTPEYGVAKDIFRLKQRNDPAFQEWATAALEHLSPVYNPTKGRERATFFQINEKFFDDNRQNRHQAEIASYFWEYKDRWKGTQTISTPGNNFLMNKFIHNPKKLLWAFISGAKEFETGTGNLFGATVKNYETPNITIKGTDETDWSIARRVGTRGFSGGLINDFGSILKFIPIPKPTKLGWLGLGGAGLWGIGEAADMENFENLGKGTTKYTVGAASLLASPIYGLTSLGTQQAFDVETPNLVSMAHDEIVKKADTNNFKGDAYLRALEGINITKPDGSVVKASQVTFLDNVSPMQTALIQTFKTRNVSPDTLNPLLVQDYANTLWKEEERKAYNTSASTQPVAQTLSAASGNPTTTPAIAVGPAGTTGGNAGGNAATAPAPTAPAPNANATPPAAGGGTSAPTKPADDKTATTGAKEKPVAEQTESIKNKISAKAKSVFSGNMEDNFDKVGSGLSEAGSAFSNFVSDQFEWAGSKDPNSFIGGMGQIISGGVGAGATLVGDMAGGRVKGGKTALSWIGAIGGGIMLTTLLKSLLPSSLGNSQIVSIGLFVTIAGMIGGIINGSLNKNSKNNVHQGEGAFGVTGMTADQRASHDENDPVVKAPVATKDTHVISVLNMGDITFTDHDKDNLFSVQVSAKNGGQTFADYTVLTGQDAVSAAKNPSYNVAHFGADQWKPKGLHAADIKGFENLEYDAVDHANNANDPDTALPFVLKRKGTGTGPDMLVFDR